MSTQKQPTLTIKKKLKDESINPFMRETDPLNPYGPNY